MIKNKKQNNFLIRWKEYTYHLAFEIEKIKKAEKSGIINIIKIQIAVIFLELILGIISLPFYLLYDSGKLYLRIDKRNKKAKRFTEKYHLRRKAGLASTGVVVFMIVVKIIFTAIGIYYFHHPHTSDAAVEAYNWNFNTASEYTFDPGIDFVSGKAQLSTADNSVTDDSQPDFDAGNYLNTNYNTDHIELSSNETEADGNTLVLYHLNEVSGTTAEDSSSNEFDASVENGADLNSAGIYNTGIQFDGTDDYLEISANLGDPSAMTIEFWFKKPNINDGPQYFLDGRNNGNWWFLQDYTNSNCPDTNGNICFYNRVEVSSADLSNNTWYHLAVTVNSSETKIYLDGQLKDTGTGFDPDLGANVRIGTRYTGAGYFEGSMDEIAIWDKVLDQSVIEQHAQQGYKSAGEFESQIFNAGDAVPWDEISWDDDVIADDYNWYDDNWQKRQQINIDNSANIDDLTDFQIRLTIPYDSNMNDDFSDLRFTQADGQTEIDFWLESKTDSAEAKVWLEVPAINGNSTQNAYMYYGNSSASSVSNGENTFILFDDFEDGVIDTAKWIEKDIPANEIAETGGLLTFTRTSDGNWDKGVIANNSLARDDLAFEFDYQWTVNNASFDAIMMGWHDGDSYNAAYQNLVHAYYNAGGGAGSPVNALVYEDGSNRTDVTGSWTVDTNYDVRVRIKSAEGAFYEQSTDNGDTWITSYISSHLTESNLRPAWSFHSGTHHYDNARVYKWADPSPVVSFGTEQDINPSEIKFQVRSCSSTCSTEAFVGPDQTAATYYTNSLGETLNIDSNQYFQYKLFLNTSEPRFVTPAVEQVNITSASFNKTIPTIIPDNQFSAPQVSQWLSFTETATKAGNSEIYYQLSEDNGSTWLYYDGSGWVNAVNPNDYNTAAEINNNISSFSTNNNQLKFKAFLYSDGTEQVQLDNINIVYLSEPNSQNDLKDWHFTNSSDYNYDSDQVLVNASNASLVPEGTELTVNTGTEALYHFNTGSGSSIDDQTTNYYDGVSTDTAWVDGLFNTNALSFNGSSSVVLPAAGEGSGLLDGHSEHTIEAWVKRNDNNNRQAIFIEGGTTYGFGLYLNDGTGKISHYIRSSGSAVDEVTYPVINLDIDQWYHLAGVWDGNGTTGELSLYVDGQLVDNKTTTISTISDPGNGWRIGGTGTEGDIIDGSTDISLDGVIEELKIYNIALDSTAVENDYNARFSGDYPIGAQIITPNNSYTRSGVIEWQSFEETAVKPANTELFYQLSNDDGTIWQWYDSSSWADTQAGLPADGNTLLLYHFNNSSGDIIDSSAASNNAVNNGAARGVSGLHGNGISFDGTDDYLQVPYLGALNLTGTDFTIEFWLQTNDSDAIIIKRYSGQLGGDGWAVGIDGGNLNFYDGSWLDTGIKVDDGQPYYVAITGDDSANQLDFYINGILQNSLSYTDWDSSTNFQPLYIGKEVDDLFFAGLLDEIRISNSIRNTDQMILAMNLYNTATEINSNISNFPADNESILFKAFLLSKDGVNTPMLDNIRITNKFADNQSPATTAPASINQSNGNISFSVNVSDIDLDLTSLQVEYSDDNGSSWYDPWLLSVNPSSGSADLDNNNTNQIGTADSIDTNSGAVDLTIVWDTVSAQNQNGSLDNIESNDIQLRVRAFDGISSGSYSTSSSFTVDNIDDGGNGGGGGGGGGGGFIAPKPSASLQSIGDGIKTFTVNSGDTYELGPLTTFGTNFLAGINTSIIFEMFSSYTFAIKQIFTDSINYISPAPSSVQDTLLANLKIQYDLDDDGCNDFEVKLNRIVNNTADITLKKIEGYQLTGIKPNSLLKLPGKTTVYYYGKDCRRHIFPNPDTYFSWFTDFSQVNEISEQQISQIPLAENITFKPGVYLAKITTDPKVYAVSRQGVLHWLTSGNVAQEIFGDNWQSLIKDVPDPFFINYIIGAPIESISDYDRQLQLNTSATINIDKGYALPGTEQGLNSSADSSTSPVSSCKANITFTSFMSYGTASDEIKEMQKVLQCLGYIADDVVLNGYFGNATFNAVKSFQADSGIDPVGYVGPGTREALNNI